MPILQIHMMAGRDDQKKRVLVEKVTTAVCDSLGVPPEQVRVILSEMAPNNYGVAGVLKLDQPPK